MLHNLASFQSVNLSIIRHGCQSIASLTTKKKRETVLVSVACVCACVQTHNKLLSMHTRLSLCINLPQARLSAAHNIHMYVYVSLYIYMCIYILIRAFKNNTIYSALPPPLLLVLFFCRLCIIFKTCTATKSIFHANWVCAANQPPFPPLSPSPSPSPSCTSSVDVAASVAVDVAVIIAAFGIANFAASHRSLPLTTWKICCHCHVTHKIQHKKCAEKEAEKRKSDEKKKNTRSEAKTSYTSSRAVAKCVVCERGEGVRHNLIESVISINFKSLLMRIDKNTRRASFAAT